MCLLRFGKSYMLAALAVLMLQCKYRVVYISDCYLLLQDPVDAFRRALVAAFIDDAYWCDKIKNAQSADQLEQCCQRIRDVGVRITFIFDQTEALDPHPDMPDTPQDLMNKGIVQTLLEDCSSNHIFVCGASSNQQTAKKRFHLREATSLIIDLNGGLSQVYLRNAHVTRCGLRQVPILFFLCLHCALHLLLQVELQAWLTRYEKDLPLADMDSADNRAKLLHYSGGVPLLLFHFLSIAQQQATTTAVAGAAAVANAAPASCSALSFDSCWEEFAKFRPLQHMESNLRTSFVKLMDLKHDQLGSFHAVRDFLIGCITGGAVCDGLRFYDVDCRYFWCAGDVGRCLNGFVRDTMCVLLHELQCYHEWMRPQIVFDAYAAARNPSVRSFLVRQACVQSMLTRRSEFLEGLRFRPSAIRFFVRGSESAAFVQDAFCVLYVPRVSGYSEVDAVLRILPSYAQPADFEGGANTEQMAAMNRFAAIIVPIRIASRSIEQLQSHIPAFLSRRTVWLTNVHRREDLECAWIFHWIVPQKEANKVEARQQVNAVECQTRDGLHVLVPKYSTFVTSIETVIGKPKLLRSTLASLAASFVTKDVPYESSLPSKWNSTFLDDDHLRIEVQPQVLLGEEYELVRALYADDTHRRQFDRHNPPACVPACSPQCELLISALAALPVNPHETFPPSSLVSAAVATATTPVGPVGAPPRLSKLTQHVQQLDMRLIIWSASWLS